jgi:predicted dehydrogenase
MASSKINVLVVGAGFMGLTHLKVYQQIPRVRIVAICDAKRQMADGKILGVAGNIQQAGDFHVGPGVKMLRDFDEALATSGADVVDICTPTALHAAQVIAALKAGKHVLCEKPLATSTAEAKEILKIAGKSKGLLMPAMCMRFWPGWSQLKEVVEKKTYGHVLAAGFGRFSERPGWGDAASHPGGALLDMHIHDTDFVQFLFGRPSKVSSIGVIGAKGTIDHVVTQYFFPDGPAVYAEGSWLQAKGFNMSFLVHCEQATLDFDLRRGAEALQIAPTGKPFCTAKLRGQDGYHEEIRHFIECVGRGAPSEVVSAEDALGTLEICAAEEKSVRTGQMVKCKFL